MKPEEIFRKAIERCLKVVSRPAVSMGTIASRRFMYPCDSIDARSRPFDRYSEELYHDKSP